MRKYAIRIDEYLQLFSVWHGNNYLFACSPMRNQTIRKDEVIEIECECSGQAYEVAQDAIAKQNEPAPMTAPFTADFSTIQ